jgi:hypothetical protein
VKLYRVSDIPVEEVVSSVYDVGFFASGYEERCTHVARLVPPTAVNNPIILGFSELFNERQRLENDLFFDKRWTTNRINISGNDDQQVLVCLRALVAPSLRRLRLLVDYSSMSRLWYSAILNWARYVEGLSEITVDLLYSVGDHRKAKRTPMGIKDILALPGYEGATGPRANSVAVFGLGFDSLATLCVLDRLEPDICYSYYASPAAFDDYPERVRSANQEMIAAHSQRTLELPLSSVEQTFRYLVELITPHRGEANIIFVPMGPKPHVLATLLVAMRFREVGCLRVSGQRTAPEDVGTTGAVVATRMEFRSNPTRSEEPIVATSDSHE